MLCCTSKNVSKHSRKITVQSLYETVRKKVRIFLNRKCLKKCARIAPRFLCTHPRFSCPIWTIWHVLHTIGIIINVVQYGHFNYGICLDFRATTCLENHALSLVVVPHFLCSRNLMLSCSPPLFLNQLMKNEWVFWLSIPLLFALGDFCVSL